jgi:phospholipid/cholesterol/gamma-HCH transport system substrate-binding protein
METRANYVLIGAFTLAAVVGAFLFIMWIAGYGSSGGHRTYQVVFKGSVAGLSTGANVSFNGIKIGEVTHLTFSRSDTRQVVADIDVNSEAPIDKNTRARLETQGLTGGAVVALLGGVNAGPPLAGQNGQPPIIYAGESMQLQDILDSVAALSSRATTVLDDADKIIAENSPTIHSALANVDQFSKALADNSSGIDAALKSVGELGKQIGPLAARLQTLSDDSDRLVQSIDPEQVRAIVGNVQAMSAKGVSVIDRADKLLTDNSDSVQSTLRNADVFSKALADSAPNIDVTLKNLAELSKTVQPVVAQIQSLSQDADRVIKAVDPDQIHALIGNAQTFSQALAESSQNFEALARNGALLATHLNEDTSKRLDTALDDVNDLAKAIDSKKIASIVDSANDVAQTVRQNRDNIDSTLKNFSDMSAKLNESADKVDGVLTAAQSFLGSPGTKGAVDRISDAALSIKRLADDVDSRVKDISAGLSRFTNSGLREYEALAVEGRRVVGDIDRVVRSLGNNPSQVLFGSRPALPEYHGGQ